MTEEPVLSLSKEPVLSPSKGAFGYDGTEDAALRARPAPAKAGTGAADGG